MPLYRNKLQKLPDNQIARMWERRIDTLEQMGFPTTAEIHRQKLVGASSDQYTEQDLRTAVIESVLSLDAIVQEHKEPRYRS